MAAWQWVLLAVPAVVLLLSIVMIVRTLMGATAPPATADHPAPGEPGVYTNPADREDPVELGGEFDDLFVDSAESARLAESGEAMVQQVNGDAVLADEAEGSEAQPKWSRPIEADDAVPQRVADTQS